MKLINYLRQTGWLCVCLLLWTACSKDTDDKLDGKWQIQQVEADGYVQQVDTFFYNIQTSLFRFQVYDADSPKDALGYPYPYRTGYKTLTGEDEMTLEFDDDDETATFLALTDWISHKRLFTIEKVSGSQLILYSEGKRYTFRKF